MLPMLPPPSTSRGELGALVIDDDADGYRACCCRGTAAVLVSAAEEEEEVVVVVVVVLLLLGVTLGECRCVESMVMVGRDMAGVEVG